MHSELLAELKYFQEQVQIKLKRNKYINNMETKTTIERLLSEGSIVVPDYQRAYSWEADKHVKQYYEDLSAHVDSNSPSPYYLGHFLFEMNRTSGVDRTLNKYYIVDGQQRLTTTVVFVSSLLRRLISLVPSNETAFAKVWEQLIKSEGTLDGDVYRFDTVGYDRQFFRDCIVAGNLALSPQTSSQQRILDARKACDGVVGCLDAGRCLSLLRALCGASCTTHVVSDPAEAVQMFIFQNNRGKKPTNLEIVKAQFMYEVHLKAESDATRDQILVEITSHFELIYRLITELEGHVEEDDVLRYTHRVHENTLSPRRNELLYVEKGIADEGLSFIRSFTILLRVSFERMSQFFRLEKTDSDFHLLNASGYKSIAMPFVIKALSQGVSEVELKRLARSLGSLSARHRIVGTRADIVSRLQDVYKHFVGSDIQDIVVRIDWMKTRNDWWGYWSDDEIRRILQRSELGHPTAKFVLWLYENYLITNGKSGYAPLRYDAIENPHLEHIAPQTENKEADNGYPEYTDEFRGGYIYNLGNYLLLSGSHNESLSNACFSVKRASYTHNEQQREVMTMTETDLFWGMEQIKER